MHPGSCPGSKATPATFARILLESMNYTIALERRRLKHILPTVLRTYALRTLLPALLPFAALCVRRNNGNYLRRIRVRVCVRPQVKEARAQPSHRGIVAMGSLEFQPAIVKVHEVMSSGIGCSQNKKNGLGSLVKVRFPRVFCPVLACHGCHAATDLKRESSREFHCSQSAAAGSESTTGRGHHLLPSAHCDRLQQNFNLSRIRQSSAARARLQWTWLWFPASQTPLRVNSTSDAN
jgi:hypothetical protein